ncbi:CRISPR-associated RAMP protein, Cmr1 family [Teredinibacter turnerae T7901]|uniref:CRISPR-associated RAMP protein, Cmr1 family n=1 Tax=Teredinibacter turnerae (strain ATCC 39867 / T7901) TaxID=377629 RepID=C5BIW8_TERTT|nr:type III-B CRISPR module RAMP protein Cmr1 [Teredinibacter turnerae]ACR13607.1 CRISPR-associated RAMP protein, Cmr1 family [Teredinibacter turnerae T7901]
MPRLISKPAPQPTGHSHDDKNTPPHPQWRYNIQVVTPMFGGGVEARVLDPSQLIRGTSIRGHLRFWWRATRGAKFDNLASLREREAAIWGDTDTPSRVQLQVRLLNSDEPKPVLKYIKNQKGRRTPDWAEPFKANTDAARYIAFPFIGKSDQEDSLPDEFLPFAEFQLALSFSPPVQPGSEENSLRNEVEAALWAWVNFGGLGARTRRGFGSLSCAVFSPQSPEIPQWLEEKLNSYGILLGQERPWPTLKDFFYSARGADNCTAWLNAVHPLKLFRQGEFVKSGKGNKHRRKSSADMVGRDGSNHSLWPEANAIRTILKKARYYRESSPNNAFPRAAFGLPIITQFKQNNDDISGTELYPIVNDEPRGRMASPLITKSLNMCPPSGGGSEQGYPFIVRLSTALPSGLGLRKTEEKNPEVIDAPLDKRAIVNPDFTQYPDSPMDSASGGSAIEAFLSFITGKKILKKLQSSDHG